MNKKFEIGDSVVPKVQYGDQDEWYGVKCKIVDSWVHKGKVMYLLDNGLHSPEHCGRKVYEEKDLV